MSFTEENEPQWAEGCPCGITHLVAAATARMIEQTGAWVRFIVPGLGAWVIPKVYIAAHGLTGRDAPALAEKYGWEKVE